MDSLITDLILRDLEASKLDESNNKFKEAYNTGIDVAIGIVERWKNIEGVTHEI
jgi:hypothetical protein